MKILWKMWNTCERYDPELHQRNRFEDGSWIIGLISTQHASLTTADARTARAGNGL
ncbi:MAG: hypothetical protein JSU86_16355 [Phycisphaerales bacterium]|nr:MAG: hypothetical protein JSU86_16355 [Phycisphaerales bacterium]